MYSQKLIGLKSLIRLNIVLALMEFRLLSLLEMISALMIKRKF
jgi:hypothetical protein